MISHVLGIQRAPVRDRLGDEVAHLKLEIHFS